MTHNHLGCRSCGYLVCNQPDEGVPTLCPGCNAASWVFIPKEATDAKQLPLNQQRIAVAIVLFNITREEP